MYRFLAFTGVLCAYPDAVVRFQYHEGLSYTLLHTGVNDLSEASRVADDLSGVLFANDISEFESVPVGLMSVSGGFMQVPKVLCVDSEETPFGLIDNLPNIFHQRHYRDELLESGNPVYNIFLRLCEVLEKKNRAVVEFLKIIRGGVFLAKSSPFMIQGKDSTGSILIKRERDD